MFWENLFLIASIFETLFWLLTRLKCKSRARLRIAVKKDLMVKKVDINCKSKKEEETEKNMLKIEKKLEK